MSLGLLVRLDSTKSDAKVQISLVLVSKREKKKTINRMTMIGDETMET